VVIRQFDVFRNPREKKAFPFLLVVQHDVLESLSLRVVVPLAPKASFGAQTAKRLNPVFTVDGSAVVMLTQMLGAVQAASLGKRVTSLSAKRAEIIGALDVLFTGV
jgi:toxin CcdB